MNAPVEIPRTDCPIVMLMPDCCGEEYQQRRRIQSVRNIMTAKIPELEPGHALQIAWIAIETATVWLYAPADLETITEVAEQLRRLMIVADTAANLETQAHG